MINYRFDPRSLLFFCIIISSVVLSTHSIFIQSSIVFLALLFALLSKSLNAKSVKLLYKLRHLIVSVILLQVLFRQGGDVYFAFYFIKITEAGLIYAYSSLLRYMVIIIGSIILSKISLDEFLEVFYFFKLPRELALTLTFGIQYLNTFSKQLGQIKQVIKNRNLFYKLKAIQKIYLFKELVLPVLIRSLSEVQYKAIALELKGIALKVKHVNTLRYKTKDYLFSVLIMILVCFIYYLDIHR